MVTKKKRQIPQNVIEQVSTIPKNEERVQLAKEEKKVETAPAAEVKQLEEKKVETTAGGVQIPFRDVTTGEASSFTDPRTGRTFFGPPNLISEAIQRTEAELTRAGGFTGGQAVMQQREQEQQLQQAGEEFKQAGVFEEPQKTDLAPLAVSPERSMGNIPIISPILSAFAARNDLAAAGNVRSLIFDPIHPELSTADPSELLRMAAENEIDKLVIESGDAVVNRLSMTIESIPFVGEAVGKYTGSLLGTPTGKALTLKTAILDAQKHIDTIDTSEGLNPSVAFDEINKIEREILIMESKLKFFISQSSVLRAAPEIVNDIEIDIDTAKSKIRNTRLNIAGRRAASIKATEAQLYETLEALEG